MVLAASTGHQDQQWQDGAGTPTCPQGAAQPWASAQFSIVTGVMDSNTDPRCSRGTDPDMTLSQSLSVGFTKLPGCNTGHPDLCSSRSSMNPKHQHDLRCQPKLPASACPSVSTRVTDINTEPSCSKAKDSDMDLGSSLGMDITMAPRWHCRTLRSVWPLWRPLDPDMI